MSGRSSTFSGDESRASGSNKKRTLHSSSVSDGSIRDLLSRPDSPLVEKISGAQRVKHYASSNVLETGTVNVELNEETGVAEKVNDYIIGKVIGRGAFAKVCRSHHVKERKRSSRDSRREYAIKIMSKQKLKKVKNFTRVGRKMVVSTALDNAKREIAIMKKIEHPHLVKLYEVIQDDMHDKLFLVMEFVPFGQIQTWDKEKRVYFSRLKEERSRRACRDILSGLDYLHAQSIVHLDLKPENLLVGYKGRIKIADFGVSRFLDMSGSASGSDKSKKMEGTYQFWAPECLSGSKFSPFPAEIWAFGVCAYLFTYGSLPFDAPSVPDMFDAIMEKDVEYPTGVKVTSSFLGFLKKMLEKDVEKRAGLEDLKKDSWLGYHTDALHPVAVTVEVNETEVARAVGSRALDMKTVAAIKVRVERWRARSQEAKRTREMIRAAVTAITNKEIKHYLSKEGVGCNYPMEKEELHDLAFKTMRTRFATDGSLPGNEDEKKRETMEEPSPKGCCAVS